MRGSYGKYAAVVFSAAMALGLAACGNQQAEQSASRAVQAATRLGELWVLGPEGVELFDAGGRKRLRMVPLPEWTWAWEPFACPPGLAMGPEGSVLVSSNVVPVVWRIDARSFAVTRHEIALQGNAGREAGFSELVYVASDGTYLAVDAIDGSRWRIDPGLSRAERTSGAPGERCTMTEATGMAR